ncbi:magnesium/cobalt transporter CorA [Geoalkalibacter halelectricus]|uniref:Magnesium transport protein CorA n=1 Tax=Geoalkalibacter halelectricus TaxID=2847045 RepID=A0ABY5ZP53_9BACT|nr:magnesium/cobalt transporter CorA [Geoalkalibacter halelectricus]MDO3377341.1 magnesium/cobalt transporter CorA [Geoalkalibacter halelectricus]UWZ80893.1 magnesium/cobalt transporter CorA [Geoalkalibacter halelectricus]
MARKLVKKRGKKVGAAPGTLVHVGDKTDTVAQIRVVDYDQEHLRDQRLKDPNACRAFKSGPRVAWINVEGVHEVHTVEALGQGLGLHPLVMEDILNTDQRPKVESYDDYLYIVIKMLQYDPLQHEIRPEQVSLILARHYVLSCQERAGNVFDGVRERLRTGRRIRFLGTDYLAYALLDAIVDNYFALLEQLGERIEALEEELITRPTPATLAQIHHFKREMLLLRKAVWPLREALAKLTRDETSLIAAETRIYLRDVYDHCVHVLDTLETLRDLLAGMLDLYLSSISNRMNEIMKVLTIMATIFIPLTFIAGVYGMNFEHMPELAWPWAYPAVLLLMLGVAAGLLVFFRLRKWI